MHKITILKGRSEAVAVIILQCHQRRKNPQDVIRHEERRKNVTAIFLRWTFQNWIARARARCAASRYNSYFFFFFFLRNWNNERYIYGEL